MHHISVAVHNPTGPVSCQLHSRAAKWESEIYSLTVEGKGLRSLTNIAAADKLVTANFADNVLVGLAGLHACKQLRELNLSNNLIVEVRGNAWVVHNKNMCSQSFR